MTRDEMLMVKAMEECNEVSQRLSKALRFGVDEVWTNHPDGKELSNRERVLDEYLDLYAALSLLWPEEFFDLDEAFRCILKGKRDRIEEYLKRSEKQGTLVAAPEGRSFASARQGMI